VGPVATRAHRAHGTHATHRTQSTPLADLLMARPTRRPLCRYTGADLSEVCQHAAKIAIKQTIEEEIKKMKGLFDGQPNDMIDVHHLEHSVRTSRKSVTEEDLASYSAFATQMKRMAEEVDVDSGLSMSTFSFANNPKA